jgi:RNA polymerase sigma-70 factor, ECF subfamily
MTRAGRRPFAWRQRATWERLLRLPKPSAIRAKFEELYALYRRDVWAMAYARWVDADMAMDLVQEAFLRLWKQLEAGEDILNPRAWLLRVTRNLAEDNAKSAFRRHGTQAPEVLSSLPSAGEAPPEQLERIEVFGQIRVLLEELSSSDREILTMKYALEYDGATISERLGIPVTAVHMRLSRARQRLAELLTTTGVQAIP